MNARVLIRITAPIGAVSLLLLTVGIFASWYVHQLQKTTSDLLDLNVTSVRVAEELEIGIREIRTQLNYYLLTGDRKYLEAVPTLRAEAERCLNSAEALTLSTVEHELLDRVKSGYARFFEEFDRATLPSPERAMSKELRNLGDELLTTEILLPAHEYLNYNKELVKRTSEQNISMADRTVLSLLLLGTCGAMAGLLAGYGLARGFNRSIVQMSLPIRDAAGKLNEVVGPITISAGSDFKDLELALRKMADHVKTVVERLAQSQREVLRAEQLAALGQLAAGLAHELRNPLMAIKILVQSATAKVGPPELQGRDLVVLEEEIARLELSIQTFLDFARPPKLEKRAFEIQKVLRQTVDLVSARAEQQATQVVLNLPEEPVLVEADIGQIRQVVLNLLLNALDAVREGGEVRIALQLPDDDSEQSRDQLRIQFDDSGCGLPDELGARIFEPFVSTKEIGLGLGLSICQRILEEHGGAIFAANRPEGGACFTVTLPLHFRTHAPRVTSRV